MSEKLAYVIFGILALYVWGECRARQGAAEQRLRTESAVTDSAARMTDRFRVAMAWRESTSVNQVRRLADSVAGARREIARLRLRISSPDTGYYDSVAMAQIAVRDTIIREQDRTIAALDSTVTLWRALAEDRGELARRALAERDQYRAQRDAFRRQAQPGLLKRIERGLPYLLVGAVIWEVAR